MLVSLEGFLTLNRFCSLNANILYIEKDIGVK